MFAHKVQSAIGALSSSLKGKKLLLKSLFFFFFFFFCRKGTRGLSLKQGSIYLFEALSWKVIPLQVCFM